MKKILPFALAAAMFCAGPFATSASAADVDVAKITCKEFLEDTENMPMMIMWIDGYMSAKSDNTEMSDAWLQKLSTHLGMFCGQNPNKTIMAAMEAMPAE